MPNAKQLGWVTSVTDFWKQKIPCWEIMHCPGPIHSHPGGGDDPRGRGRLRPNQSAAGDGHSRGGHSCSGQSWTRSWSGGGPACPSNQNHANIQHDLESCVSQYLDKSENELRLLCEMLVRAYDPCISSALPASCNCNLGNNGSLLAKPV